MIQYQPNMAAHIIALITFVSTVIVLRLLGAF
jgi:hypothetical protein